MFSATVIGFIVGISVATWAYTQTMRRTGGNNKSSLTTGAAFGAIAGIFVITIVWTIDSMVSN